MKNKNILTVFIAVLSLGLALEIGYLLNSRYHIFKGHTLDRAGSEGQKKILYYRNPMNPQVTSPVPMKDQMGMDYVPVYEEESVGKGGGIYISAQRQQMIGVKKETVEKRQLSKEILTVGKVAYDPELYVAQEEYLQALKMRGKTSASALKSVIEQSEALLKAAERKLLLLGMSKEQVEGLAKEGKPQENLYLPLEADSVWIYMTIYEYEMGMVKPGLAVEAEAVAYPGEVFKGKIISLTPVLDPMTRSVNARAQVENPGQKLKPDMYLNVKIKVDLGEKLAVPEDAVINTGEKTLAVITDAEGNFYSRQIKLGQRVEGYYEVLDGLREGDIVVTSANFLIDSESRLQSAISGEHQH